MRSPDADAPGVSIVVPVLNEAPRIAALLAGLQHWRAAGHEIIVVDGGSTDGTPGQAAGADRILQAQRGRASQMNAGARAARGRLLLFLHADTALPPAAQDRLEQLARGAPVWGRFDVRFDARGPCFSVIATMMNLRSRLSSVATGDQAMFVARELFDRAGGFPPLPLMEDVALSKRLRALQRPLCLRDRVTTAARRWQRYGVLRTVLLMWALRLGYWLGVPPGTLARIYHGRT